MKSAQNCELVHWWVLLHVGLLPKLCFRVCQDSDLQLALNPIKELVLMCCVLFSFLLTELPEFSLCFLSHPHSQRHTESRQTQRWGYCWQEQQVSWEEGCARHWCTQVTRYESRCVQTVSPVNCRLRWRSPTAISKTLPLSSKLARAAMLLSIRQP
jgi:hypothetical protein